MIHIGDLNAGILPNGDAANHKNQAMIAPQVTQSIYRGDLIDNIKRIRRRQKRDTRLKIIT